MRKSWNGLLSFVQEDMNLSPYEENIFVFMGKSLKQVKIFYWDGNGFCICMKKLEKGKFPFQLNGKVELTRRELTRLLSGVDFRKQHQSIIFSNYK
jgi:transposase